jgi:hypothetical protein
MIDLIKKIEGLKVGEKPSYTEHLIRNKAIDDCLAIIRKHSEPVSITVPQTVAMCVPTVNGVRFLPVEHTEAAKEPVSLERCKIAAGRALIPDCVWNIEEGFKIERIAKAVLTAAGVKYKE